MSIADMKPSPKKCKPGIQMFEKTKVVGNKDLEVSAKGHSALAIKKVRVLVICS
jgi:hypothetical protein